MGGGRRLLKNPIVRGLKRVNWRRLGVRWAVLFGGLAGRGSGSDVDLLVLSQRGLGGLLYVILEVSEALRIDPGLVDVVDASTAPCVILRDAWLNGVVVYEARRGEAREWLLPKVEICLDYEISRRKLGVVEEAVKAAKRRWG